MGETASLLPSMTIGTPSPLPAPASPLLSHLYQLGRDSVPHFDYPPLTAAHDVVVIDPGGPDGVFVFKRLQALPCLDIPF